MTYSSVTQMGVSSISETSSSSAKQESLSWVAATIDWDFESAETNPKVIFAGPESIEEPMDMQEEEDPSLISEAESNIKSPPRVELSDDAFDLGEGPGGKIPFGGILWHPSWAED